MSRAPADDRIADLQAALAAEGYVADRELATVLYLASTLPRPLLLEGEPGVGKTDLAVTLARVRKTELIRLSCYEGIDAYAALYEWDHPRQLMAIRMHEARGDAATLEARDLYTTEFLLRRPLLRAIDPHRAKPPVLLIDEIDRADEAFEAFLLELLADYAVTIPELGTIRATHPPHVIVTSNRTRDIHDALKRRCLYHWIDHPSAERERRILRARRPDLPERLAESIVAFVQRLRAQELVRTPGMAETLDWAASLEALGVRELDAEHVERTLGALLKNQEDRARLDPQRVRTVLAEVVHG